LDIRKVSQSEWFCSVLGSVDAPVSLERSAGKLVEATKGYDFFCPAYEAQMLVPLFLALRNRAGANIRLLFIAHAPGAYVMEWTLMRPLLRDSDIIIAPSSSARETIEFLCPELTRFVRVVPHPMHLLPRADGTPKKDKIVTLARIHPGKLLHRQIEAMAVLRRRCASTPRMFIAGPLSDGSSGDLHSYARSLAAKIRRLGLEDYVQLTGHILGDADKAQFIAGARMMVYLSVTIEEAFPKASVEALGMGVPVISTLWDGFPETVGNCGALAPVCDVGRGAAVDAPAERIADAIEMVMESPPTAKACREQAHKFSPDVVRPMYRSILQEALDYSPFPPPLDEDIRRNHVSAAPNCGLLGVTAPLTAFSWSEVFALHLEETASLRAGWEGKDPPIASPGARLRGLLIEGVQKPLERFLGKLDYASWIEPSGKEIDNLDYGPANADLMGRAACAALSRATRTSRQVCLSALADAGQTRQLEAGLEQMRSECVSNSGLDYLRTEYWRQTGDFSKAFELCTAGIAGGGEKEFAFARLRQLARICREWGRPELTLPWLREWLATYPDSPHSGLVWLDLCVNVLQCGGESLAECREALREARCLLGESSVFTRIEQRLGARLLHGIVPPDERER
jgi:glycosyltransferase involved in cell wall biosynthesis